MDNRLKVRTGCKILALFETIARFPQGKSGDDTYVYLFWFCPILVVIPLSMGQLCDTHFVEEEDFQGLGL